MTEPRIEAYPSIDKQTQQYRIDVILRDLVSHNRVQIYLSELLTRTVQMALMERYADIQAIVDEVLLNAETKELVRNAINNEIKKMVEQVVKEVFGRK